MGDDQNGTAATRAHLCATKHNVSWSALSSCASVQGQSVLQAASNYFARHPEVDGFPTIQVNGKEPWGRTYQDILEALCKTGISAGACKSRALPLSPPFLSQSISFDAAIVV